MTLTKERRGEIAYTVLKNLFDHKGVKLNRHLKREISNKAKEIGVPVNELWEFVKILIDDLYKETFG